MREDLDQKLVKAFPNLYFDRYADMRETCMCWGFECGDGWFQIIWDLSEKLEAEILKYKKIDPTEDYLPCASQVKEKFGSLRFYMNSETDEMSKFLNEAENKSAEICEICGKRGRIRGYRWLSCRCVEHAIENGDLSKNYFVRQYQLLKEVYYSIRWRLKLSLRLLVKKYVK